MLTPGELENLKKDYPDTYKALMAQQPAPPAPTEIAPIVQAAPVAPNLGPSTGPAGTLRPDPPPLVGPKLDPSGARVPDAPTGLAGWSPGELAAMKKDYPDTYKYLTTQKGGVNYVPPSAALDDITAKLAAKSAASGVQQAIDSAPAGAPFSMSQKLDPKGVPIAGMATINAPAPMTKPGVGFGASGAAGAPIGALSNMDRAFGKNDQALFAQRAKNMGIEGDAASELARLQSEGAGNQAQIMRNGNEDQETFAAENAAKHAERVAFVDGKIKDYEAAEKEASDMKVDPGNYWSQKSTGGMVLSGIALALGALGAGATGQNAAVGIIEDGINQDIAAQKANLANKREGVAAKKGMLGLYMERMGNEDLADAAAKADGWKQVMVNAQTQALQTSSDTAKAQAESLIALSQGKIAEYKDTIASQADAIVKQQQAAAAAAAGAAAAAARNEQAKQTAAIFAANVDGLKERMKTEGGSILVVGEDGLKLPNGQMLAKGTPILQKDDGSIITAPGSAGAGLDVKIATGTNAKGETTYATKTATSKEDAAKFKAGQALLVEQDDLAKKIAALQEKAGHEFFSTDDRNLAKAYAAKIQINMKKLYELKDKEAPADLERLYPSDPLEVEWSSTGAYDFNTGIGSSPNAMKMKAFGETLKEEKTNLEQTYLKDPSPTIDYGAKVKAFPGMSQELTDQVVEQSKKDEAAKTTAKSDARAKTGVRDAEGDLRAFLTSVQRPRGRLSASDVDTLVRSGTISAETAAAVFKARS